MNQDEIMLLWKLIVEELIELKSVFEGDQLNKQFYRRSLFRNIYSSIEAYLYIIREFIKINAILHPGKQLEYNQLMILYGKTIALDSKGNIKENDVFFQFEAMLRFTLSLFAKQNGIKPPDFSDNNYAKLINLSKRRNDITHPKSPLTFNITNVELLDIIQGFKWFMDYHIKVTNCLTKLLAKEN